MVHRAADGVVERKYPALNGEPLLFDASGELYERPVITSIQAQLICSEIYSSLGIKKAAPKVELISGRPNSRKHGEVSLTRNTIMLYRRVVKYYLRVDGWNERTLLHELAHILVPPGIKEQHHGAAFKKKALELESVRRGHSYIGLAKRYLPDNGWENLPEPLPRWIRAVKPTLVSTYSTKNPSWVYGPGDVKLVRFSKLSPYVEKVWENKDTIYWRFLPNEEEHGEMDSKEE